MKEKFRRMLGLALCAALGMTGGASAQESGAAEPQKQWHFGFGSAVIEPDPESGQPLYIAGYNSGWEIDGVLDLCQARAVWLDAGGEGVLIIGVDCVALDSGTIGEIRAGLGDIPNCAAVNVYSTHTHAGPDTLGLWGPTGVNGKNDAYMQRLIEAAQQAARQAAANIKEGTLHFGKVRTQGMLRDSRTPHVYDEHLYQLRFAAQDGSAGLRMLFFGAHAESLRGNNRMLSRDFPGLLCDQVQESTGDDTIFLAGAAGGLLMTQEFVATHSPKGAQQNLQITADRLTEYALSIAPEDERELQPELVFASTKFTVPLDNPAFALYRFLGILHNEAVEGSSATGYHVRTELAALRLADVTLALLPGEIFPELVLGGEFGQMNPERPENPEPLCQIAQRLGAGELLIVGLANDELGYIVPPSDFLLNEEAPYIKRTMDSLGEDHYEETNSVGPECAAAVARAFEETLRKMQ
ncbi:MAG: hypothetical protein Q4A66_00415 [Eubacteriales bacterium]|nr:hypothetical protein [Eubacteriales bacterium]